MVAVHYCTGSGPAFHSGTEFASLADRYGFIVIYPSATRSGSCFDVSSPQALRHDGGSDPVGIVSMVRYVQQRHNADPGQVYVTGASSGAMMTNVLLGAYPDVFKAGAAFMGVPFACFATTDGSSWNSACANGTLVRTPQQWGDLVRGPTPVTAARARACNCGTAPRTPPCATPTSRKRSSSGRTSTGSARPPRSPTARSRTGRGPVTGERASTSPWRRSASRASGTVFPPAAWPWPPSSSSA
ncbi:alpha/beta hydrolase family esterase [Streptosporangium lutulentum]